jgi:predicted Rossmann fold flavoprotein
MEKWDFIVIGGGAAGFFGAIACAEAKPKARILILEATARTLTKVKISGGGRCNVTHNQFDAKRLVQNYPRGQKELMGPFHHFQPRDTVEWFEKHGVKLKAEADGRMFPITNDSQTIIHCLESTAEKCGVTLRKNSLVQKIESLSEGFVLHGRGFESLKCRSLLLASGSAPFGVSLAQKLGHTLIPPVPSLFTFEISHSLLKELPGVSFSAVDVSLKFEDSKDIFKQQGPCLITHWGLSGPAVLKLSAFAARHLYERNYRANLVVNWVYPLKNEEVLEKLEQTKKEFSKKKVVNENPFPVCVRRFWETIVRESGISVESLYGEVSKKQLQNLARELTHSCFNVTGKGVFKEEFVTAGGVARDEIHFKTMESKVCPGLYFAGEVIDIDGITGGFNFQNAWTGAWLAGRAAAENLTLASSEF